MGLRIYKGKRFWKIDPSSILFVDYRVTVKLQRFNLFCLLYLTEEGACRSLERIILFELGDSRLSSLHLTRTSQFIIIKIMWLCHIDRRRQRFLWVRRRGYCIGRRTTRANSAASYTYWHEENDFDSREFDVLQSIYHLFRGTRKILVRRLSNHQYSVFAYVYVYTLAIHKDLQAYNRTVYTVCGMSVAGRIYLFSRSLGATFCPKCVSRIMCIRVYIYVVH